MVEDNNTIISCSLILNFFFHMKVSECFLGFNGVGTLLSRTNSGRFTCKQWIRNISRHLSCSCLNKMKGKVDLVIHL